MASYYLEIYSLIPVTYYSLLFLSPTFQVDTGKDNNVT